MNADLNLVWYSIIGLLFAGYAMLDGFDLGVGMLHLLTKKDGHRRMMMTSIGPLWNGNEVWLVTGGGALFAAFPEAYATVFSGFYGAFILLLFGLIFRAVAMEFRSEQASPRWRAMWDVSFSVASLVVSLLFGVALGNLIRGIPLNADHEFAGSLLSLLNPYSLLVGVTTLALFAMHGSIYVVLKTEGELHEMARRWVRVTIPVFIALYAVTTVVTMKMLPHMLDRMIQFPVFLSVPLLTVAAILGVPLLIRQGKDLEAFVSSCGAILGLIGLSGIGTFPNLVRALPDPAMSLTLYNAASSHKTLGIMLVIVCIGVPLVLAYTISIYYIFRGKVRLDEGSY